MLVAGTLQQDLAANGVAAESPQLPQASAGARRMATHMAPPWPECHEAPLPPFLDTKYEAMWECLPPSAHPASAQQGGKQQYTVKDAEGRVVTVRFGEMFFGIQALQNEVSAMKIVKE